MNDFDDNDNLAKKMSASCSLNPGFGKQVYTDRLKQIKNDRRKCNGRSLWLKQIESRKRKGIEK